MLMNGAQAVLESLRKENVEVVFGYPGGAVLTLYDELYKMRDELRKGERTDYKRSIKRADVLLRNLGSKQHWINGVLNYNKKETIEWYQEFTEFFS